MTGDKEYKDRWVNVRLTGNDYAQMSYMARKAGMTHSELIRTLLYHGSVERHTTFSDEYGRILHSDLCDISNSIARVSYNLKLKDGIDEGDYLQLESALVRLVGEFGEVVTG